MRAALIMIALGCGPGARPDDAGGSCVPGTGSCAGESARICKPDGTGYIEVFCDPAQGLACNDDTGLCEGACAPQNLGSTYTGCEYFATVTGNLVSGQYQFAVVISNVSAAAAQVTIDGGELAASIVKTIAPGEQLVEYLPWVPQLKGCTSLGGRECSPAPTTSGSRIGGAYHIRTTQPVMAYQFNPLDYTLSAANFSYSNDASLLLPWNALRGKYMVAAWQRWSYSIGTSSFLHPSQLSVTATRDNTHVTITATANVVAGGSVPQLSSGETRALAMNAGDVIELRSFDGDLTGSIVESDKPVQVIGGHYCTFIPETTPACDHLEESMFPIEALSNSYVVTAPRVPAVVDPWPRVVRIVAIAANTTITYDPPQAAPTFLANPGDVIEISANASSFHITADHKILVVEYMQGQEAGGGTGDPSMALAVPTEQYRTRYVFLAPLNYRDNYVAVVAPRGAVITLDDVPVTGFQPVGTSSYDVAHVWLPKPRDGMTTQTGTHTIESSMPFGITVYGYGNYTSYWYPGGLDLNPIILL